MDRARAIAHVQNSVARVTMFGLKISDKMESLIEEDH